MAFLFECKECGKPGVSSNPRAIFCNSLCRQRFYYRTRIGPAKKEGRPKVACKICAAEFTARDVRSLYCSDECRAEAELRRWKAKLNGLGKGWAAGIEKAPRRACVRCGEPYYAHPKRVQKGQVKYCSNHCRTSAFGENPSMFPQISGRRANGGKRPDLNDMYFRSAWEANYARYLNWLIELGQIKKWEFEVDTFEFKGIKKGTRFYTPDFKVYENDDSYSYHEVKGYMDAKSETKLKRMAKYYPQERVIVIGLKEYKEIYQKVSAFIPNWEGRQPR